MQIRLHKYLAHAGVASLRASEKLIQEGKVIVNGKPAVIGQPVDPEKDTIVVNGKAVAAAPATPVSYRFYKPKAVMSTATDPEGRKTVLDFFPPSPRLLMVGRLDYMSEGLMLLTTDGEAAYRLTHPKYEVEKTYRVLIRGNPTEVTLDILRRGVHLKDGVTAPARVEHVVPEGGNTWLDITIHEGKNHEIRRMCEALHHTVLKLIRTRLGPYELGDLQPGQLQPVSLVY